MLITTFLITVPETIEMIGKRSFYAVSSL